MTSSPLRIALVIGSTRPGRRGPQIATWLHETAETHADRTGLACEFEIVDIAAAGLPLLDEPVPAAVGSYRHDHTRRWAGTIEGFDGFVFIVPEHNHSVPASVKNAVDYLFAEWNDKAAAFVTYGVNGGTRAAEHLRQILAEVKVATVRSQVALGLFTDFEIPDLALPGTFTPAEHHRDGAVRMIDELLDWAGALRPLRRG